MQTHDLHLDDGATLVWVRRGPPEGLPTVLVPGLSDGLAPLGRPGGDRLARTEVPAEIEHLSGYLVSHRQPLGETVDVPALADDVAAFVERVVGGPAVLSGHSLGGLVALRVAATHPSLVRAVIASGCGLRPGTHLDERLRHWEELLRDGHHDRFAADALAASATGSDLLRRRLALRVLGPRVAVDLVPRHVALSRAVRHHDASNDAPRVRCPVLVMAGTRDPLVPVGEVDALAEALADVRVEWFEGLAHGFPEQAPRRFARRLAAFLRGIADGPALGWSPAAR